MMTQRETDQGGGATPPTEEPRYGSRPRGGPREGSGTGTPPTSDGYGGKPPSPPGGNGETKPPGYAQPEPSPEEPAYPAEQPPPKKDYGKDATAESASPADGGAGSGGFGPDDETKGPARRPEARTERARSPPIPARRP